MRRTRFFIGYATENLGYDGTM